MSEERATEGVDAVAWPVRTARLEIRPATVADGPATWQYRRLESVAHWITSAPSDSDHYLREVAIHVTAVMSGVVRIVRT